MTAHITIIKISQIASEALALDLTGEIAGAFEGWCVKSTSTAVTLASTSAVSLPRIRNSLVHIPFSTPTCRASPILAVGAGARISKVTVVETSRRRFDVAVDGVPPLRYGTNTMTDARPPRFSKNITDDSNAPASAAPKLAAGMPERMAVPTVVRSIAEGGVVGTSVNIVDGPRVGNVGNPDGSRDSANVGIADGPYVKNPNLFSDGVGVGAIDG